MDQLLQVDRRVVIVRLDTILACIAWFVHGAFLEARAKNTAVIVHNS